MLQKKGLTDSIRLSIIEEHLAGASKNSLARKYNLHSGKVIGHWMRTFDIETPESVPPMSKKEENDEILRLRQELKETKSRLAYERMRADAYDKMSTLAEMVHLNQPYQKEEYQIPYPSQETPCGTDPTTTQRGAIPER